MPPTTTHTTTDNHENTEAHDFENPHATFANRMLAAAFTLGFFGLLGMSEFTVSSRRSFDLGSTQLLQNHFKFTTRVDQDESVELHRTAFR